jgi:hypothetical protein
LTVNFLLELVSLEELENGGDDEAKDDSVGK